MATCSSSGTTIAGSASVSGSAIVFTPGSPLSASGSYQLVVCGTVKGGNGAYLGSSGYGSAGVDFVRGFSIGIPAISQVSPNSGFLGQSNLPVTLTGQNTHWLQGTSTVSFGASITINTLTVATPTSATAYVNIPTNATPGPVDVTVTTGGETVTLAGGFTINGLTAVTITVPAGVSYSLAGSNYTGTQTVNLAPAGYTLATTTPQSLGSGTQALFNNWSDSGAISHAITVGSSPVRVTGSFTTQYQLTANASPSAGGILTGAGFYDSGTAASVTATANNGYSFTSWTGPVANPSSASTSVTMDAAKSITANFAAQVAPLVTTNPQSQSVMAGTAATFTAAASGQPTPAVQWYVSTDGGVSFNPVPAATSTTLSFITALTDTGKIFQATFSNPQGHATAGTATLIVNSAASQRVSYQGADAASQGTWTGKYGSDGFFIAGGAHSNPSYATVNIGTQYAFAPAQSGASFAWSGQTSDIRALQNGSGATNRIASTYVPPNYGNSFQSNIVVNDNNTHQLALYLLDWDTTLRQETITFTDYATQQVLATQSFNGFSNGLYAVFNFQGSVTVTVAGSTGSPALSGMFFGTAGAPPPPPSPSFTLSATVASAAAGSSGSSIVSVIPANGFNSEVTLAASNWPAGISGTFTTNPASSSSSVTINVGAGVTPGPYALIVNGTSGTLTASTTISLTVGAATTISLSATPVSIAAGAAGTTTLTELPAPPGGTIDLTLNTSGWPNGITPGTQSGNTLGINVASSVTPGLYSLPLSGTKNPVVASTSIALTVTSAGVVTSSATYTGLDATTQGAWGGKYGSDGYVIANDGNHPPSYAAGLNFNGTPAFTWAGQISDPKALQLAAGSATGIASSYYGNSFNINVPLSDGATHQIALYLLDWDTTGRSETISILDAATNNVLDQESFTGFHNGQWAVWNVKGNVIVKVTVTGGANAVVSGIFFAPAAGAPPPPQPSFTLTAAASTVAAGSSGDPIVVVVPANGFNSAVTLAVSNWPAGITGTFGTNPTKGSSGVTITVGSTVTPGPYSLTLIGTSGAASASTTIALTVTSGSGPSSFATFTGFDATTKGAWTGKYGASGYMIAAGSSSASSYATSSVVGDFVYAWSAHTTDPRALQSAPGAANAVAAAYTQYTNNSFTINVNIVDGNAHSVSLYLLDWDSSAREETITVIDAVTNVILDTQTFSNFGNGVYASWNMKGNVIIKVTPKAGSSAVVSGVFFN